MNKNLKNNNIYLKQYTFVTIYTTVQKLGQCFFVLFVFWKKFVFIQQGFVKLIETVIVKIYIVRKHLSFE